MIAPALTLLTPEPMSGVHPRFFVQERTRMWIEQGNVMSKNLDYAWHAFAETLNQHLRDCGTIHHHRLFRFPLETGGGKTTGLRLYCAILGGIAGTADRCPGVLITAQRKADCDLFVEEVNRLGKQYGMTEPMAVAFHSGIPETKKVAYGDLQRFPFLVTTQKGLIISLVDEGINGLYWQRLPSFLKYAHYEQTGADSWDGTQYPIGRRMVVMDETLDPFASFSVSPADVDTLMNGIPREMVLKHRDILRGIGDLRTEFNFHAHQEKGRADLERWRKDSPSVVPLINDLRNAKEAIPGRQELLQLLASVYYLQQDEAVYKVYGSLYQFQRCDYILKRLGRGAFILDATAHVSKLLGLYKPKFDISLRRTRDYSNLTIEVDRTTPTGRNTLGKTVRGDKGDLIPDENAKATAQRIVDELSALNQGGAQGTADKQWYQVGVISFKSVIQAIEVKRLNFPNIPGGVVLGNIGGVVGSNDFRDCDLLYIVGQNHRQPDYGSDIVLGFQQYAEDHLRKADFAPYYEGPDALTLDSTAKEIQDAELARDLIQLVGRGNNRCPADAEGKCKPSTVRVTLDSNPAISLYLMGELQKHFHKAVIVDRGWVFNPNYREGDDSWSGAEQTVKQAEALRLEANRKGKNNIEKVLYLFHSMNISRKSLFGLTMDMGLKKEHANWIKKALSGGDKYDGLMTQLGIGLRQMLNTKGKLAWFLVRE